MAFRLLALFALCAAPVVVLAQDTSDLLPDSMSGLVRMLDADTLVMAGQKIRLHGVDAPESRQTCVAGAAREFACGERATEFARTAFDGAQATCLPRGTSYDRIVATCHVNGADMGRVLVRAGWAVAATRYSQAYIDDEAFASDQGWGMHTSRHLSPHEFRRHRVTGVTPPDAACRIKGNISASGRIFHSPGQQYYSRTTIRVDEGERWFCTPSEARAAGFRAARR